MSAAKRRDDEPTQLGAVVRSSVDRHGWGDRLEGASIVARWEELVGADVARRCVPVRLVGGLLVVRAESNAWATQVRYLAGEIVRRADEVLRPGLVREVRVTVAGSDEPPDSARARRGR